MDLLHAKLHALLQHWGIAPQATGWVEQLLLLAAILLAAYTADFICRRFFVEGIRRITRRTKATWDDILFNDRVLNHLCHIIPPIIIYALLPVAFPNQAGLLSFLLRICMIYIIAVVLRFVNVLLSVLFELTSNKESLRDKPLKGVFQIAKVGLFFIGAILIVGILIDKSPLHLIAGLGASAAVLMLVFKDTITGFVSGIQLAAYDMLRPGDWITMEKYGANGIVVDVTLNTVKVRNWDNTITTIPPYALVSDSFQNWRGMRESGGRRIKRFINIDMDSVQFCTPEMLVQFSRMPLIQEYIANTQTKQLTNLGIFRIYLEKYIENLPDANIELVHMVRQLQPTETGIPLEIYFFCKEKEWIAYERVQAEVFDHILAIAPQFSLRIFQLPSGSDLRNLQKASDISGN